MLTTFRTVFRKPLYVCIASMVSLLVFSLAVWLPNFSLIGAVLASHTASILQKILFVFSLYGGITTNFTLASASYTVALAILSGLYVVLFWYYLAKRKDRSDTLSSTSWLGIGGVVSGFFGVGCAACGTFLLTSLATAGSGSALILYLPFEGEEFGFLGVGLLAYAVYSLCKKIGSPQVCS